MRMTVPKEIKSKTKVARNLYLEDLIFIAGYTCILWIFSQDFIAEALLLPFFLWNILISGILIHRPKSNPGLTYIQSFQKFYMRDTITYHPINTEPLMRSQEEDLQNEIEKTNPH